jgi:hypothetical protein
VTPQCFGSENHVVTHITNTDCSTDCLLMGSSHCATDTRTVLLICHTSTEHGTDLLLGNLVSPMQCLCFSSPLRSGTSRKSSSSYSLLFSPIVSTLLFAVAPLGSLLGPIHSYSVLLFQLNPSQWHRRVSCHLLKLQEDWELN